MSAPVIKPSLRFDRREWSGAFGDVGTDFPLLIAILAATGLAAGPVFIAFGIALTLSGWIYRLPMPVQPLKAMAVVVIAGQASGAQLQLGGLMLGGVMLLLALSGGLDWLARVVPLWVVRGVQAGLALNLGWAALKMAQRDGWFGWLVAAMAVGAIAWLRGSRRWPIGLLLVLGGGIWAWQRSGVSFVPDLPSTIVHSPDLPWADWPLVLLLLVLPQLPLSLSNSILATERTVTDFFPERAVRIRGLGFTFAALNFVAPFFGGVPVCHGCGGLAGHYVLGARTGGSVVIYGACFMLAGVAGSEFFTVIARNFPFPLLAALLLVESSALLALGRDQLAFPRRAVLATAIAVGCVVLPYGYLIGAVVGTLVHHLWIVQPALRHA